MEKCCKRSFAVGQTGSRVCSWLVAASISMVSLTTPALVTAQDECATVKDCAQDMVALANDLKDENAALLKRIETLEAALAKHATDASAALERRVDMLRNGNDSNNFPGGNGTSGICPKGSYMVGALWQSDPGGSNGQISWFGPICRGVP